MRGQRRRSAGAAGPLAARAPCAHIPSMPDPTLLSVARGEVIPTLKVTDLGLVDVETFQLVPLWA